jgi:hypothetical protein
MGLFNQGQALLWRISLLTDPVPDNHPDEAFLDLAAPDLRHGTRRTSLPDPHVSDLLDRDWVEPDLAVAAMIRDLAEPPEQSDADVDRLFTRALGLARVPD